MQINSSTPITTFTKMNSISVHAKQDTNATLSAPASQMLNGQNNLSNENRKALVSMVEIKQQQALVETAQNAYQAGAEESATMDITGEIAREAAKKQNKQSLAISIIERIQQSGSDRPHIQVNA